MKTKMKKVTVRTPLATRIIAGLRSRGYTPVPKHTPHSGETMLARAKFTFVVSDAGSVRSVQNKVTTPVCF